jgi:hypothetical protein
MDYWRSAESASPSAGASAMISNSYNSNQRNPSYQLPTPSSATSGVSAIDRILASSPHTAFREVDGYYNRQGQGEEGNRGYVKRESERYGQGTAAPGAFTGNGFGSGVGGSSGGTQTAKRGSKACVACESSCDIAECS